LNLAENFHVLKFERIALNHSKSDDLMDYYRHRFYAEMLLLRDTTDRKNFKKVVVLVDEKMVGKGT
jgi:hypothetical protein